jgi:pimeloyl-ACP methyl ester carboxylesterase
MLEGFEDRYADVNGTRLHYVIGGEGEPLVLMDGFPRTWHGLHKIMTPLAEHFRVIAVDYGGQGESDTSSPSAPSRSPTRTWSSGFAPARR